MKITRFITISVILVTGLVMMLSLLESKGYGWTYLLASAPEVEIEVADLLSPFYETSTSVKYITDTKFEMTNTCVFYGDTLPLHTDFMISNLGESNLVINFKVYNPTTGEGYVYEFLAEDSWIQQTVSDDYIEYLTPVIYPLMLPDKKDLQSTMSLEDIESGEYPMNPPLAIAMRRFNSKDSPVWEAQIIELLPDTTGTPDFEFNDGTMYLYSSTLFKCD